MTDTGLPGRKHLLLFCSSFFSYPSLIKSAFERLGYDVTWVDDRASNATSYKTALRLFPRLTSRLSTAHFARQAEGIGRDVEHIVVIRGEGLSAEATRHLRQRFPDARMSLYLWDSVRNSPNPVRAANLYDAVYTFDPVDAEQFGWRHRPLFAVLGDTRAAPEAVEYDWSFVGTIHSDRYRVIKRMMRDRSRRSFVFGYFPTKLLYYAYALRNPSLVTEPSGRFSTESLPPEAAKRVTSVSKAVLDVEHPRQAGLTLRTIETLLSGRKLITTNRRILDSELYHPSRVYVVDRNAPQIPASFFNSPGVPLSDALRYRYSIDGWANEVLGNAN